MRVLAGMNATETASGLTECWDLQRTKCVLETERTFGPSAGGHRNITNLTQRTCCITWRKISTHPETSACSYFLNRIQYLTDSPGLQKSGR